MGESCPKLGAVKPGGYGQGELVVSRGCPSACTLHLCAGLWGHWAGGGGDAHHLVAYLRVPTASSFVATWIWRLARLPPSWGCNFIRGMECVQYLLIVQKLQKALPGGPERSKNSSC